MHVCILCVPKCRINKLGYLAHEDYLDPLQLRVISEPKRHIVLLGKRNLVGGEDKTDKSEDYEKFHEIPPFTVKTDPSIVLNDEDCPWLRCKKKGKHGKK